MPERLPQNRVQPTLVDGHPGNCTESPFLTVAIPQYGRRRYLEQVLRSLFDQDYGDFEIVISDDDSPDDARTTIPPLLRASGRAFRYFLQPSNLRYDRNLRFCIDAARGTYVMLLGNDDSIYCCTTLSEIAHFLRCLHLPDVAFCNYINEGTGHLVRRARSTAILSPGPTSALHHFGAFTFVSGVLFKCDAARRQATDRWDGSTFYQTYVASRIIASGGRAASLDLCGVRQDIRVDGQPAPTYATTLGREPWSWSVRTADIDWVLHLTCDAVLPFVATEARSDTVRQVIRRIYRDWYLPWLFEYRRVANWGYAFGLARGLWPQKLLPWYDFLTVYHRLQLWIQYLLSTALGLLLPQQLFVAAKRLMKRLRGARS